jgi:glycosyltransferase involved in cell wall biosynthesis
MNHPVSPRVSVLMITYDHERYIAQAVESAVMQKTDFDYEVVIGEDCSTDSTRQILLEYQKRYPDKIRLLLQEKNLGQGGKKNFEATLQNCRGQYIALLEGDDYWTSAYKLQQQVNMLDSHSDLAMSFHPVAQVDEAGTPLNVLSDSRDQKEIVTIEDLVTGDYLPTCSLVFRAGLVKTLPDWYFALNEGDWTLEILLAQHGTAGRVNDVMAAYRIHPGGLWNSLTTSQRERQVLKDFSTVNAHLRFRYDREIKETVARLLCYYSWRHYMENQWGKAVLSLARSFISSPFSTRINRTQLVGKFLGRLLKIRPTSDRRPDVVSIAGSASIPRDDITSLPMSGHNEAPSRHSPDYHL